MTRRLTLALVAAVTVLPAAASGQPTGGPAGTSVTGWVPIALGVRVGSDNRPGGQVLGGQVWVPVWPSGLVQIVPHGDITFRTGRKERQVGVDAAVMTGRRLGGLYVGGGLVRRKASYGEAGEETRGGQTLVLGFRTRTGLPIPLDLQADIRWVFVDGVRAWRIIALGFDVPLWGWSRR